MIIFPLSTSFRARSEFRFEGRENAFEHKKDKPGLNLTPGLSANRPSNNWALKVTNLAGRKADNIIILNEMKCAYNNKNNGLMRKITQTLTKSILVE